MNKYILYQSNCRSRFKYIIIETKNPVKWWQGGDTIPELLADTSDLVDKHIANMLNKDYIAVAEYADLDILRILYD